MRAAEPERERTEKRCMEVRGGTGVCVCVCTLHRGERGLVFVLPVGEGFEQDSVSDV